MARIETDVEIEIEWLGHLGAEELTQLLARHAANHLTDEVALVAAENAAFGIGHDVLGARLCESWGLDPGAVACVRGRVDVMATHRLPTQSPRRAISVISALVHTISTKPDELEAVCQTLAPQAMLDQSLLLKAARKVKQKVDDALSDD